MKSFRLSALTTLLLSGALIFGLNLTAQEKKGPGGPPPEIQACQGKKAGDSCSFKTREGKTRTDTCKELTTPKGKELGCGDLPKPPKDGKKPEGKEQ